MTPEEFANVEVGDRLLYLRYGGLSTVVSRDEHTLFVDHDGMWPLRPFSGSLFPDDVSNQVVVDKELSNVLVALPLSEIHVGSVVHAANPKPGKSYTISDIGKKGFSYTDEDGKNESFLWEGDSPVELRLRMLFAPSMDEIKRVNHPFHKMPEARPSIATLTPGQRFHDGSHRSPKFHTVLFVGTDSVTAEVADTGRIVTMGEEKLATMFQSLQASQMKAGVTIYRARGAAQMDIVQIIQKVADGIIYYTPDSVLGGQDRLLNQACSFEQRKMYFSV